MQWPEMIQGTTRNAVSINVAGTIFIKYSADIYAMKYAELCFILLYIVVVK